MAEWIEAKELPALRRQSPAAFARFVAEHAPRVAGLAKTMGLSAAETDDASAETFAAAYAGLPKFDGRASVSTWLYRIAYRQALRLRERRQRQQSRDAAVDPQQLPAAADTAAEDREQAAVLWELTQQLEPRQAAAVDLFYRQGRSVLEIAGVLDCPENTVKTLLSRARQKLKIACEAKGVTP
jgi:RNA polymerase sigma-70 factor, ECF subfamily